MKKVVSTHLARWMRRVTIGVIVVAGAVFGMRPQPAEAVPQFAQAMGMRCDVCHTVIPGLNAFGRYILRTSFQFPAKAFSDGGTLPLGVIETLSANSVHGTAKTVTAGAPELFFAGPAGNDFSWSYVQALFRGGGNYSLFVAYHNLFNHMGHLSIGKQSPDEPTFFSVGQPDSTGFKSGSITVGEHAYHVTGSTWGAKFLYQWQSLEASLGWGVSGASGSATNLWQASDFSIAPGAYRQLTWKIASANASRFFEYGLYGDAGGDYVLKSKTPPGTAFVGQVDHYATQGAYFQSDPIEHIPGLVVFYQADQDSNPGGVTPTAYTSGAPLGFISSKTYGVELQEKLITNPDWPLMLTYRHEMIDNGVSGSVVGGFPGPVVAGDIVDLAATFPKLSPYIYAHAQAAMGGLYTSNNGSATPIYDKGKPTWTFALAWAGPIAGPLLRVVSSTQEDAMNGPNGGEKIYDMRCAACHQPQGRGVPGNYPPLAGDPRVYAGDGAGFVGVILHGLNKEMPSFSGYLDDKQVAAVATYIRSSWGNNGSPVTVADAAAARAGQPFPVAPVAAGAGGADIYTAKCAACHGATGQGIPGTFPAIAGNVHVTGSDLGLLIGITKHGKGMMPAFQPGLSDGDVAALLTYIRSSWGNTAGPVTAADVSAAK